MPYQQPTCSKDQCFTGDTATKRGVCTDQPQCTRAETRVGPTPTKSGSCKRKCQDDEHLKGLTATDAGTHEAPSWACARCATERWACVCQRVCSRRHRRTGPVGC